MLLSDGILFLSNGFPFLNMSKFSRVRFRLFVAWNIHTVVFLPNFVFQVIFVLLMLMLSVLLLVAVISLSLHFFMSSSALCSDASTLYSMLASLLHPFFLTHYYFYYLLLFSYNPSPVFYPSLERGKVVILNFLYSIHISSVTFPIKLIVLY